MAARHGAGHPGPGGQRSSVRLYRSAGPQALQLEVNGSRLQQIPWS